MSDGPLFSYQKRVALGECKFDPGQELLAKKLQSLHGTLLGYEPNTGQNSWRDRLGFTNKRINPVQGLYIYGDVGAGKSMLMDLFFDGAPIQPKRRVHFHEFLQDVHDRFNLLRTSKSTEFGDPIPIVAKNIVNEAWLLCFDEFQVYNIVDAMILSRLFESMFSHGLIVVATSNRPPADLYQNGLQRNRFIPFIDLICKRLDIFQLKSITDYRLERMLGMQVYHQPIDQKTRIILDKYFIELSGGHPPVIDKIEVKGRILRVQAAAGVARQSFKELCGQVLGAADYLAIAERYHTLILDEIPCMGEELQIEAKRFVTLIDTLYEAKVKLICSADGAPKNLYLKGDGVFEFERLVSRLMEMQSVEYMALPHKKVDRIFE